jgi:hypothetical protein
LTSVNDPPRIDSADVTVSASQRAIERLGQPRRKVACVVQLIQTHDLRGQSVRGFAGQDRTDNWRRIC